MITPAKDDNEPFILPLDTVSLDDVARVGGKNASLGEMLRDLGPQGVKVPGGFATTASAFRAFMKVNALTCGETKTRVGSARLRQAIVAGRFPGEFEKQVRAAYRELCREAGVSRLPVAVRSSATAEDLPRASFAGQHESFLNVRGEDALLDACRRCYASLYTDRAIAYRKAHGYPEASVALSVGVQRMIRADLAGSGVMFTLDTETGFDRIVLVTAAWGLGEAIVQGQIEPDEYHVFKPLLEKPGRRPVIASNCGAKRQRVKFAANGGGRTRTVRTPLHLRHMMVLGEDEVLQLARWAVLIERHYGCPMDIEWAKDGNDGELFVVQARPETVEVHGSASMVEEYRLGHHGPAIVNGSAVGRGIASGSACLLESAADIDRFVDGSILVTRTTDPDWMPVMKRAAAIVTEHGGRTSHAAIVSRELGTPALVGAVGAMKVLRDGQTITVCCTTGEIGSVYEGSLAYEVERIDVSELRATSTRVMLNLADPAAAYRWWRLPADGVGLVRMEFVIANAIRVHPMALARFEDLPESREKSEIDRLTCGYSDKRDYFIERLALGIAQIAAVAYPRPAIVRLSDFKTNEYAHLLGGRGFEPVEANPMIGFRGAARYYSPRYRDGFALECRAIRRVREVIGLDNVAVMVPFCRSPVEADRVLAVMAGEGLIRGRDGLAIYVMCEIPANAILAREFAERFDGFSIGSNDLTQLILGIDRDNELLADEFDERDPAVEAMIRQAISEGHRHGATIGLCGQAPSDDPEFARLLVKWGIDSISVTPDSFVEVKRNVAKTERARPAQRHLKSTAV